MRTLLTALLIIVASQTTASTTIIKCDRTNSEWPPKIYKHEINDLETKVSERVDAEWVPWCDSTIPEGMKNLGFKEVNTKLTLTDMGATCVALYSLVPTRHNFDLNLYKDISYMATFKTVLDFQFLSRKVHTKYERISQGMQPNNAEDEYLNCTLVDKE